MRNTFGHLFTLTTFGESHGSVIGGVIDGCKAGVRIDYRLIDRELQRRRPGHSRFTTQRQEADRVTFLSGIADDITTGAPIAFIISNTDIRIADYDDIKHCFRPGHADFTYFHKYHILNSTGGGRASGRETVARVVAGAIAKQLLSDLGVEILAYTRQIGTINCPAINSIEQIRMAQHNLLGCPDMACEIQMQQLLDETRAQGDSVGGIAAVVVSGVPVGWGEPLFDKLEADLAFGIFSIGAVKGVEFGDGFKLAHMRGSQSNDAIYSDDKKPYFKTNHAGGILGGISTGQQIILQVAFKPTPSIAQPQQTIDQNFNQVTVQIKGRHDPCIVPRALPVVEAMVALTLYDAFLMNKNQTV